MIDNHSETEIWQSLFFSTDLDFESKKEFFFAVFGWYFAPWIRIRTDSGSQRIRMLSNGLKGNRALPSLHGDSEILRTIPLIQDMFGVPKAGTVSVSDKFDRKSWPLHLAARKEISNQEETCSFSQLSCLYILIIKHYLFLKLFYLN